MPEQTGYVAEHVARHLKQAMFLHGQATKELNKLSIAIATVLKEREALIAEVKRLRTETNTPTSTQSLSTQLRIALMRMKQS